MITTCAVRVVHVHESAVWNQAKGQQRRASFRSLPSCSAMMSRTSFSTASLSYRDIIHGRTWQLPISLASELGGQVPMHACSPLLPASQGEPPGG